MLTIYGLFVSTIFSLWPWSNNEGLFFFKSYNFGNNCFRLTKQRKILAQKYLNSCFNQQKNATFVQVVFFEIFFLLVHKKYENYAGTDWCQCIIYFVLNINNNKLNKRNPKLHHHQKLQPLDTINSIIRKWGKILYINCLLKWRNKRLMTLYYTLLFCKCYFVRSCTIHEHTKWVFNLTPRK